MRAIKDIREELGVSREALAEFLGISLSSLGYYERGERTPDADTIVKLARFFNVTTDYLLGISSYRRNAHNAAVDEMFFALPEDAKVKCTEIQMALVEVASIYEWVHSKGMLVSPELFSLLIDDLKKYICAYQHIIEGNTVETNLETDPYFFIDRFILDTSQTGENLAKVVECIYKRGNIISDAVLKSREGK